MFRSLEGARAVVMPHRRVMRAVVGLVAIIAAAACTSGRPRIEAPSVTVESVRILRIADAKAALSVSLKLANPNDFALPLDAIACDVTLDRRPAASVHSVRMDPLPAGGEAKVELAGQVDVTAVATSLMALGAQLPIEYTLNGTATLRDGTALPFSRKGQISVARFEGALGLHP
jgi:LEA14-like dessication related protein